MTMERKIGEIFEYNGEWYQCIEQPEKYNKTVCNPCDFHGIGNCELDRCSGTYRSDKKSVIFKKLEKVGEPFSCNYYGDARLVMMQEYQLYDSNVIYCYQTPPMYITDYKHKRIAIEIKENKEDMEEKKLNLKPFDIQKAKEGYPVCTMDGRKARIICFDRRLFYKNVSYPILALVECSDGEDDVCGYNEKGKVLIEDGAEYKDDLMMLPEKKEGWVNVYQGGKLDADYLYPSKEDAVENIFQPMKDKYIDTVKVEWEE